MLYRNFTSQEEIDLEYNAILSVNNLQHYIDQDEIKNSETLKKTENILDQPYGLIPNETLDIFSSKEPNYPILVFIRGGYWHSMSSKDFSLIAKSLVFSGITAVIPNYSHCLKISNPEITRQNRRITL